MMDKKKEKKISKHLSYILRHHPESIDLLLDEEGWALTDELVAKVNAAANYELTIDLLKSVVENNDKKRFLFSDDLTKIRANQGHSIKIDLALPATEPPDFLYHGTAERHLASIREKGLLRGQRHHVHLSPDAKTAKAVGGRHGKPSVLVISSQKMRTSGHEFYVSDNGVWLTEYVPVAFILFPQTTTEK